VVCPSGKRIFLGRTTAKAYRENHPADEEDYKFCPDRKWVRRKYDEPLFQIPVADNS
jgi:hypothetical protein